MKLTFIGTGEAFDSTRANTSYLIENNGETTLVDCGYTTPSSLRRYLEQRGKDFLDVPDNIVFTHFHGDHFAGLSGLLVPLWDQVRDSGKKRKLRIASHDIQLFERVVGRVGEDYPGLYPRFKTDGLEIEFSNINISGGVIGGLDVKCALTKHSVSNFAYSFGNRLLRGAMTCVSGDGALTPASRELYRWANLLVHEGFFVDKKSENHASIQDVANYAVFAGIPKVAIVHVNQEERKKAGEIEKIVDKARTRGVEIFFPVDHQEICFN